MTTAPLRIASLTLCLTLSAVAAHAADTSQVAADPHGEVDISNIAGSIEIRGWNKPLVAMRADLTNPKQHVVMKTDPGRTTICVTNGAKSCTWWSSSGQPHRAKLIIHVPQGSKVHASGISASITSHGVTGVQRLNTVSGAIEADLGAGEDAVKSVTGSIRLHGSGQDGRLRVSSVSGDLHVTNVAGEIDGRTVNGTLDVQIGSAHRVRLHAVSGSIRLAAGLARGGNVKSDTVSGPQHIVVDAPAGYEYRVNSFSGHIENCFGATVMHNTYGPGSRMRGRFGDGSGRVRIGSLSGDISLCNH